MSAHVEHGLDGIYRYDKHVPTSELENSSELIEDELAKNPPRSSAEAGAIIAELTGIKRSPTQIREFLKKEIRCLKTGSQRIHTSRFRLRNGNF